MRFLLSLIFYHFVPPVNLVKRGLTRNVIAKHCNVHVTSCQARTKRLIKTWCVPNYEPNLLKEFKVVLRWQGKIYDDLTLFHTLLWAKSFLFGQLFLHISLNQICFATVFVAKNDNFRDGVEILDASPLFVHLFSSPRCATRCSLLLLRTCNFYHFYSVYKQINL